jgi:hypothetical protein
MSRVRIRAIKVSKIYYIEIIRAGRRRVGRRRLSDADADADADADDFVGASSAATSP